MSGDAAWGRVLVLNGASSVGKSTLARIVQGRLADVGSCWVIFSWDDFVPRLPERWHAGPGFPGDLADAGCRYRVLDNDSGPAALLEVGELGVRMLRAYHRAVATVARAGVNVIVEEVMITAEEWRDWTQVLTGFDVRWVALHGDVETVVARERDRGDRWSGLARGTSGVVHLHAAYDVEIDTTSLGGDEVAARLLDLLGPWLFDF